MRARMTRATLSLAIAGTIAAGGHAAPSNTLVINEVAPSGPLGARDEFVELRNVSDRPLDISGWQFRTCGSEGEPMLRFHFPSGTTMAPAGEHGQYLLIGGFDYAGRPGHDATPDIVDATGVPDLGGWQVADRRGVVVDGVGLSVNGCFEGTTTPEWTMGCDWKHSEAGTRDPDGTDTDANAADFSCEPATPKNSLSP